MPIARRAALTVLLCRPTLEEIYTLMPGVEELRDAGCALGLVVVGDGPYHPTEIADKANIDLLGHVPNDPRAASCLGRPRCGRWPSDSAKSACPHGL